MAGSAWESLPAALLQAISSYLPWNDILTSRLTCSHWSSTLAALITHLRVHVAAGCSNTGLQQEQQQEQQQQQQQQPEPAQLLLAALQALPCVHSITLVLTEHTTASDLVGALDVIGAQAGIHAVELSEVDPIYKSMQARSYGHCMHLRKLRHVRALRIKSPVSWSLDDVWQQVAAMTTHSSSSSSSTGAPTSTAHGSSSSSSSQGPHLQSLRIDSKHAAGQVLCNAAASHEGYVRAIAGLQDLKSLVLLGAYEGGTALLGGMSQLSELVVGVGGALRVIHGLMVDG
ncbi:hypothetical protein OEZ85_005756 [Tetradesmus obliquus]|uniref:F-box domain-containing protein n=1 Tax=Tetradesmus obliquus TaxID=3088 RepID=A0ABY8UGQ1_TETOB|nr:hypothetical protein OEZ85_005756 [Tetradesmus obliquus]